MKCKHYSYKWQSVVGFTGGCSIGLFGGFHAKTCNGGGNCPHYEERAETTIACEAPVSGDVIRIHNEVWP